jgi:superfamily II DNA or RNA helicase
VANGADGRERALQLLTSQSRREFAFQADLAGQGVAVVRKRGRLLVVAPTGSGKTLISHLIIALLGQEWLQKIPHVLIVVPSKGLVEQHFVDAAWLRSGRPLAIHALYSDTPLHLVRAILLSQGVVITTPVTITRRLAVIDKGSQLLKRFDCAIFDEIDTYLTVDDLEDRRDSFPALQMCLDAELPVIGFTGTNLSPMQSQAWQERHFSEVRADVPDDWLPFTPVAFTGILDESVIRGDAEIRQELREAFILLARGGPFPTWRELKALAADGEPQALRILGLCGERLALFESFGSGAEKMRIVEDLARDGSLLVLTRFRRSAEKISDELGRVGIASEFAHGGMNRDDVGDTLDRFRKTSSVAGGSLVLTRELGGRGLDFPNASSACLFSPRSNYQAVGQELARIRSRQGAPKRAVVLYYRDTEEEAKARRLGLNLRGQRYGNRRLFTVDQLPGPAYALEDFEGRVMFLEETIAGH